MKVFDLGCEAGHAFEGWFGSEDDYARQKQGGLLECPFCASRDINKRLSAPRLNLGRSGGRQDTALEPGTEPDRDPSVVPDAVAAQTQHRPPSPEAAATMALMHKAWLKAVRHVIETTEDVGGRFAEEARRIHYGESPERGIRGQTTALERESLLDEGIDVVPLPMPKGLGGLLQ
jgi:hypothetical protein